MPSLLDQKARLRAAALARRDGLSAADREACSRRIAAHVLALPELAAGGMVSGFWPIRSEVDLRPLLAELHGQGRPLALPAVTKNGLVFRGWAPGDPVAVTGFGLTVPLPEAPVVAPRILLVPLSAFDRTGGRLGYGKGHYDGALAALAAAGPTTAIGVAFGIQEADAVPLEPHDRRLDLIVTEAGPIRPPAVAA